MLCCTSAYRRRCSRGSLARRCGSIIGDGSWHWRRFRVNLRFLLSNGLKLVGEQVVVGSAPKLVVHVCCLLFLARRIGSRGKHARKDAAGDLSNACKNIAEINERTQWIW